MQEKCNEIAKETGLSELTLKEIDAEIKCCKKCKK
jgi:hypothetical protein